MNPNIETIETLLHAAPQPWPPTELKDRLIAGIRLAPAPAAARRPAFAGASGGWLRRWWPVLFPGAVSLACAAALVTQHIQLRNLKQSVKTLQQQLGAASSPATTARMPDTANDAGQPDELGRLQAVATELRAEVSRLENLQKQEQAGAVRPSSSWTNALTAEDQQNLAEARERALSINCVNNLKQLALAARIWAGDHKDIFPPDWLSMTNEMGTPRILVCPADSAHSVAEYWQSFSPDSNCSYEFLAPSSVYEPTRVLFRCPVHGNVCLADGSVQKSANPEWLVRRDGKLYYEQPREPANPTAGH